MCYLHYQDTNPFPAKWNHLQHHLQQVVEDEETVDRLDNRGIYNIYQSHGGIDMHGPTPATPKLITYVRNGVGEVNTVLVPHKMVLELPSGPSVQCLLTVNHQDNLEEY